MVPTFRRSTPEHGHHARPIT